MNLINVSFWTLNLSSVCNYAFSKGGCGVEYRTAFKMGGKGKFLTNKIHPGCNIAWDVFQKNILTWLLKRGFLFSLSLVLFCFFFFLSTFFFHLSKTEKKKKTSSRQK